MLRFFSSFLFLFSFQTRVGERFDADSEKVVLHGDLRERLGKARKAGTYSGRASVAALKGGKRSRSTRSSVLDLPPPQPFLQLL
jgi:hypothetical protein